MPVGMEIYGPDGSTWLSMTTKFCRFFGYVVVSDNGSMSIPEFSQGTPFYVVSPIDSTSPDGGHKPVVTVSGITMSWAYLFAPQAGRYKVTCRIYYGVY